MRRIIVLLVIFFISQSLQAGDVEIKYVELVSSGKVWRANVTLEHGDTGWDHYADAWRLLDKEGNVLGTRVLYHPHEHEQPFTRSLGNINIPEGVSVIFVEARDKKHGWSPHKVKVDLNRKSGDRFKVSR
jgi:hypothetical protein